MKLKTHLNINNSLCGKVTKLEHDYAEVLLYTTQQMSVDEQGLVHGGFVFGAADYAAMCAVNDPYVVLGASSTTFVAPLKVGDVVCCKAQVTTSKGKKKIVAVKAMVNDTLVFQGMFTTFVLTQHVLKS